MENTDFQYSKLFPLVFVKPRVPVRTHGSEQGSMTLESAIVVPLVLLCTFLMFYLVVILYERAAVQTAADGAVISASISWINGSGMNGEAPGHERVVEKGLSGVLEKNLYWRIMDGEKGRKVEAAADESVQRFQRAGLEGFSEVDALSAYDGGVFNKSIHITVNNDITLREEQVPGSFSITSLFRTTLGTQSMIPDIPEFQRNIDFVVELEQDIEEKYPELKAGVDKYRGLLNKIHGYIGGLL